MAAKGSIDRLSHRAFARRVGVSPTTIDRLCQDGRLPMHRDGAIKMPAGLKAYRLAIASGPATTEVSEATEVRSLLQRAQVRERTAKAEERELQLREKRGELADVAEVQADARAACEVIRSKLLALPGRVALQVEALVAGDPAARAPQIEALIADEINVALEALHKTRFGGVTQ